MKKGNLKYLILLVIIVIVIISSNLINFNQKSKNKIKLEEKEQIKNENDNIKYCCSDFDPSFNPSNIDSMALRNYYCNAFIFRNKDNESTTLSVFKKNSDSSHEMEIFKSFVFLPGKIDTIFLPNEDLVLVYFLNNQNRIQANFLKKINRNNGDKDIFQAHFREKD